LTRSRFLRGRRASRRRATRTAERIAQYLLARSDEYSMKIVTQDWHLDPGEHWSSDPNFVTTCQCTAPPIPAAHGFMPRSLSNPGRRHSQGSPRRAYSGFDGLSQNGSTLAEELAAASIGSVTVVGFATDHCVKATALDARRLGFDVTVLLDLCAVLHQRRQMRRSLKCQTPASRQCHQKLRSPG